MTQNEFNLRLELLKAELMNIPTAQEVEKWDTELRVLYKSGHRDTRHHAVEIVNKYFGGE